MSLATVRCGFKSDLTSLVLQAMATLGMANTRGLEDPCTGPMLLSHAYQHRFKSLKWKIPTYVNKTTVTN